MHFLFPICFPSPLCYVGVCPLLMKRKAGGKPARRVTAPSALKGKTAEDIMWTKGDDDEDITSDSDDNDDDDSDAGNGEPADEDEPETADQKRIRLAKEYIRRVQGELVAAKAEEEEDAVEYGGVAGRHAAIAEKLKEDVLAARGDLQRAVASELVGVKLTDRDVTVYRGHQVSAASPLPAWGVLAGQ